MNERETEMRCKECGIEVDNLEVFCPNCGAPLRMTADYDFIQAEIGGKVDQFLNDKDFYSSEESQKPARRTAGQKEAEKTIIVSKKEDHSAPVPELTIIGEKPRHESENGDTIAITKAIYGKDTVFSVDGTQIYDDLSDEDEEDDYEDEPKEINEQTDQQTVTGKGGRSEKELARIKARARERKRKKRKRIILICVIAAVVVLAAVGIILAVTGKKKEDPDKDTPDVITSNVEEGASYSTPFELSIWSEQDNKLYYTLDGNEPNRQSVPYGQPIRFTNDDINGDSADITLKVVSYSKNAPIIKGKSTFHFTLVRSEIMPPYMEPDSGDYWEEEYIYIYGPDDADIYYTYDGSTPSKNSTLYTGPIQMKRGNYVLNAIAIDKSGVKSEVSSYVYNLIIEPQISEDYAFEVVLYDLLEEGLIEDEKADDSGQYKVPGGGIRRINRGGTTIIDNESYSQGLVVFCETDARDYVDFMLRKAQSDPLFLHGALTAELRLFDDEKGYDGLIAYHVRQIRPCSVVRLFWEGPDLFRLPFFSLTGAARTAVYEWVDH